MIQNGQNNDQNHFINRIFKEKIVLLHNMISLSHKPKWLHHIGNVSVSHCKFEKLKFEKMELSHNLKNFMSNSLY